jgi:hypothetical protein
MASDTRKRSRLGLLLGIVAVVFMLGSGTGAYLLSIRSHEEPPLVPLQMVVAPHSPSWLFGA